MKFWQGLGLNSLVVKNVDFPSSVWANMKSVVVKNVCFIIGERTVSWPKIHHCYKSGEIAVGHGKEISV
jgi:hypothetical protein